MATTTSGDPQSATSKACDCVQNNPLFGWVLGGVILALPGYLILGTDFMHLAAEYYISQPMMMARMAWHLTRLFISNEPLPDSDMTLIWTACCTVTAAYAATCTFLHILFSALGLLVWLYSNARTETAFLFFWYPCLALLTWLTCSPRPWAPFVAIFYLFRATTGLATVFHGILCRYLLFSFHFAWVKVLVLLNRALYLYYHRNDMFSIAFPSLSRPYEYKTFQGRKETPTDEQEIRLLRVPRRFLGEMPNFYGCFYQWPGNCELETYPLGLAPAYDCISYTWGSSQGKKTRLISVNGRGFLVGTNVFSILCNRRSWLKDRLLWIDSICIDQKNKVEKETQIPIMKEIYRRSRRVVVHIKPTCGWKESRAMRAAICNMSLRSLMAGSSILTGKASNLIASTYGESSTWKYFEEFLSDDWFNRVWVIQEVAVAPFVEVVIGNCPIGWIMVENAIKNAYDLGMVTLDSSSTSPPMASSGHFLNMLRTRNLIMTDKTPGLMSVLMTFVTCAATDPRDKVWALLGLTKAAPGGLEPISLDYADPSAKLVCKVARYLVEQGNYLPAISMAGIGWRPQQSGVPSWVQDWTRSPARLQEYRLSGNVGAPFTASAGQHSCLKVSDDGTVCSARGWQLGKVVALTAPFELSKHRQRKFNVTTCIQISSWLTQVRQLVADNYILARETSAVLIKRKVWATIIAGRDLNLSFATPEYLARVEEWEALMSNASAIARLRQTTVNGLGPLVSILKKEKLSSVMGSVMAAFKRACLGRRFGMVQSVYPCLVPPLTQQGDLVCILAGAEVPVVLRPVTNGYELVGECYVHDVMHGESQGHYQEEEFLLV